jgi:hypothetical protein
MNERRGPEGDERVLLRIYGEFLEMPGLRLSVRHAQRLFGLGEHACARLLDQLVAQKFLTRQRDGAYVRLTDGPAPLMSLHFAA